MKLKQTLKRKLATERNIRAKGLIVLGVATGLGGITLLGLGILMILQ